jgi:hypothetical protein
MAERTFMDKLRMFFGFEPAAPLPSPPAPRGPAIEAPPPPTTETANDDRLPDSSRVKVVKIRALLLELEERAAERGLFEETLELQRLKTAHLPRLLQSYVEIPPEHRAEVFRETGRSASFLLNERLDKIVARLEDMSRQLARGNLDAFAENIRFVDNRYGANGPFD